jgi:hypothetical protein
VSCVPRPGSRRTAGALVQASRGAIGGASGDAGVEYRRAVAAYAVAYGLADLPLPGFGFGSHEAMVSQVSLETDDPVDDIRIDYVGGTSSFVQAKRTLAGGPQFASAAEQWRRAALQGLDVERHRLVIVAGRLSEPMRRLQQLLHRYDSDELSGLTKGESQVLARLDAHLVGLRAEQRVAVLRCASIFELDVEEPLSEGARAATTRLAGRVCLAEDAELAWLTLTAAAGQMARHRAGQLISGWLSALRAANVRLLVEGGTRVAELERAHQAVESYESELRRSASSLDLRSLGASLAPISMSAADAEIRVLLDPDGSKDASELAWVAMRRGRVILTGLPGGGKSTAMLRAAAQLADVPHAPLPVFASLKEMFARERLGSFRQRLLAVVAGRLKSSQRELVKQVIEDRLDDGWVMLFLDGLDETYDRKGKVVAELQAFLASAHEDVGIVLATRDVAYSQAATLGWGTARLMKPRKIEDTVREVLQAGAAAHGHHGDTRQWVAERATWISDALSDDSTLEETPLLPVLLALLAIERGAANLPRHRAMILLEVINAVVDRHERHRREHFSFGVLAGADARDAALVGFGAEGTAVLANGGHASFETVRDSVSAILRERWGLSLGHSLTAAQEVVRFWDEHGIFIIANNERSIAPRIALFAEVGAAKQAVEAPAGIDEWMARRLASGQHECMVLAAGLSEVAASSLATLAIQAGDPEVAHAVVQAVREGAVIAPEARQRIRQVLLADAMHPDADGWRSWTSALRFAGTADWASASSVLDGYPPGHEMVGAAYRELADRPHADLIADPQPLLTVLSTLRLEKLPKRIPSGRADGYDADGDFLEETHLRIARLLCGKVDQAGQIILSTLHKRAARVYDEYLRILSGGGYGAEVKEIRRKDRERIAQAFQSLNGFDEGKYFRLVDAIAGLGRPSELTPAQSTRMDELADYVETLNLNNINSWPLINEPDELPQVLRIVASLGGFDLGILSSQAGLVSERIRQSGSRTPYFSLFDQAVSRSLNRWNNIADPASAVLAIGKLFTLGVGNALVGLNALWKFPDPDLAAPMLRELLPQVSGSPPHQRLVAGALCSLRGVPEPDCWLDSDDPGLRECLASDCPATVRGRLNPILSKLVSDEDGCVREQAIRRLEKVRVPGRRQLLATLAGTPDPGWMCRSCCTPNPAGQARCQGEGCRHDAPQPARIASCLLKGDPVPGPAHRARAFRVSEWEE